MKTIGELLKGKWNYVAPRNLSEYGDKDAASYIEKINTEVSPWLVTRVTTSGRDWLQFTVDAGGATTPSSNYPRSELQHDVRFPVGVNVSMTNTVNIRQLPIAVDGEPGRIIIGQIHGGKAELCRLYVDGERVYFVTEQEGDRNNKFLLRNTLTKEVFKCIIGLSFDYTIEIKEDVLKVSVNRSGVTYSNTLNINRKFWSKSLFKFHWGVYMGVSTNPGAGHQARSPDETARVLFYKDVGVLIET